MHCEMTIFVFTARMRIAGVPFASVPSRSAPCSC
jgi:hypothetical protein